MKSFFLFFLLVLQSLFAFDKVVIWGHKLHSHTHSYIHYGFFKAFQRLGYETHWLDDKDDLSKIDLHNALFLTEHQVDGGIPIQSDSIYVVHASELSKKYTKCRAILLHTHFKDRLGFQSQVQVEPGIYYDNVRRVLLFPWASDLFPEEIEEQKALSPLHNRFSSNVIYWVGTDHDQLRPFKSGLRGVRFIHSNPWSQPVSMEENRRLIQKSMLAPAICQKIQLEYDYIPCRIFKNISYGHIGITNSRAVYELFEKKIVYSPDATKLFKLGMERLKTITLKEQFEMMDFVKERHTYLNRAGHILKFLNGLGEI